MTDEERAHMCFLFFSFLLKFHVVVSLHVLETEYVKSGAIGSGGVQCAWCLACALACVPTSYEAAEAACLDEKKETLSVSKMREEQGVVVR